MPLVIGFAFLIGIIVLVLLGLTLDGPDSWLLRSDHDVGKAGNS